MEPGTLIQRYLLGEATAAEVEELDQLLAEDSELRRKLIFEAEVDSGLREIALERIAEPSLAKRKIVSPAFRPIAWAAAAAAVLLLTPVTWSQVFRPKIIATLESVENASWESSLPTAPGSELSRGYLKLTAGIGTIRFRSGASITIEAPAKLTLKGLKKAKLVSGAAVVKVPDSAEGFVLETPNGYAKDNGAHFAVVVDPQGARSDFEAISGELAVHHRSSGDEIYLKSGQRASGSGTGLVTNDAPREEELIEPVPHVVRVGTNGRSTTVIRNNKPRKWTRPDLLMLRQSRSGNGFDRRAIFSFDLSELDPASVRDAELRLNLVPSGIGFASRLPKIVKFGVYGLTNPAKEDWSSSSRWEDAPSPEDGELICEFEIPRSQQTGAIEVGGDQLMSFIQEQGRKPVTLVLVRETAHIDGEGTSLVHAFASDSHPEAAGPVLEFSLNESK